MNIPNKILKPKLPSLILLPAIWLGTVSVILVSIIVTLTIQTDQTRQPHKYNIFSAKPLVLGAMTDNTGVGDSRAAKIDKVFAENNCELTGLGDVFVSEAEKNDIPYWIVAAISFQESSCGKKTPKIDGQETYNAWGWGVYGDNVEAFESWEEGIEVVSKYLSNRFFSQDVIEPCEIMQTYTPPSQGSWCNGVEYFQDEIHNYRSPLDLYKLQ